MLCSEVVDVVGGALLFFAESAFGRLVLVPVVGLDDAGLEGGVAGEEARLLPLETVVAVTMPRGILEEAA